MREKLEAIERAGSSFVVRPYQARDRPAIREICRKTASEQPNPLFHEDAELAPMLYNDYYLEHEPESCFVGVVDNHVVGYIVGCKNAKNYEKVLRTRIMPRMLLRITLSVLGLRYRRMATYRTLWWNLFSLLLPGRFSKLPPPPDQYPAHSHFNVESCYRGQGMGHALSIALNDHLIKQGIKGRHAVLVERPGKDAVSSSMCNRRGFKIIDTRKHVLLNKITGQEWYLKLLVCDLKPQVPDSSPAIAEETR
jgi:ribosomal protein S18 acetylase RimI-like enzyme